MIFEGVFFQRNMVLLIFFRVLTLVLQHLIEILTSCRHTTPNEMLRVQILSFSKKVLLVMFSMLRRFSYHFWKTCTNLLHMIRQRCLSLIFPETSR